MMTVAKRTGRQVHPEGGVIDLTTDERERFKKQRIVLGFTHRSLALRIGTSSGTISNIETGRSGQVSKEIYSAAYAVLFSGQAPADVDVDTWKKMVGELATVPDAWQGFIAMAQKLKKPSS